jgi:multiple sugar transport system ATP-binding protein
LDLYHHPRNLFVAGFIGSPKMNFVSVTVTAVNDSGITVKLPGDASVTIPVKPGKLSVGERATLGIRPEHLRLDRNNATVNGEVLVVERLGGQTYLYVKIAGGDTLVTEIIPASCAILFLSTLAAIFAICLTYRVKPF